MKRKVLILVDWFLPAYKAGGPIKSVKNMVDLLRDEFEFYILTGDRDLGDQSPFSHIEFDEWQKEEAYHIYYTSLESQGILNLQSIIDDVQPDVVYVNGVFSTFFSFYPLLLKKTKNLSNGKWIVAPRGMLGRGALQKKSIKKQVYLFIYRQLVSSSSGVNFQATDDQEFEDIENRLNVSTERISLAGNVPDGLNMKPRPVRRNGRLSMVYISRMAPEKNVDTLLEWLNEWGQPVALKLYGKYDSLEYQNKINNLLNRMSDQVEANYEGILHPDSVPDALASSDIFVTLTHGENFGHSIFEAMSAARPVIIGPNTPWSDIESAGGGFVVDSKGKFFQVMEACQNMSATELNEMGKNAYNFAHNYISESELKERYLKLFGNEQ